MNKPLLELYPKIAADCEIWDARAKQRELERQNRKPTAAEIATVIRNKKREHRDRKKGLMRIALP